MKKWHFILILLWSLSFSSFASYWDNCEDYQGVKDRCGVKFLFDLEFELYQNEKLMWVGKLDRDEKRTEFVLPKKQEDKIDLRFVIEKKQFNNRVAISFKEELMEIVTYEGSGSILHLPTISGCGLSFVMDKKEDEFILDKLGCFYNKENSYKVKVVKKIRYEK